MRRPPGAGAGRLPHAPPPAPPPPPAGGRALARAAGAARPGGARPGAAGHPPTRGATAGAPSALLRRTTLGLTACQGLDCIDDVAARMGGLLGWDAGRQKAEVERYQAEIEPMRRFSTREP